MTDRFPQSVTVCRVYQRKSAKGTEYFAGLWGGARVAMLKTNETDRDGNPIWELRLSAAPPRPSASAEPSKAPDNGTPRDAKRDWQAPTKGGAAGTFADDQIPF